MYGLTGRWSSWDWPPTPFKPRLAKLSPVNLKNPLAKEIALYYYEGDFEIQAPLPVAG